MARTRYRSKAMQFESIQYNGDLQALLDFGLKLSHTEWKDVHVGVFMKDGYDRACPVGHHIVKSLAGDIEILSPDEFAMKYEQV